MVIRVLGILCVGVAHQSNKSTQLEITNAEALVTLVRLLRTSTKALIQVGFSVTLCLYFSRHWPPRFKEFFCDWSINRAVTL